MDDKTPSAGGSGDDFGFPEHHFEHDYLFDRVSNTVELLQSFEKWWTTGGTDSRMAFVHRCSRYITRGFPRDLNVLLEVQSRHAAIMAWANDQVPEVNAFMQQAIALHSEEALKEVGLKGLKDMERKRIVDGRCAVYSMTAKAFERLSATCTHRLETLRTQVATERAMWEANPAGSVQSKQHR